VLSPGGEQVEGEEDGGTELGNQGEDGFWAADPQHGPVETGQPEGEGEEDGGERGDTCRQEAEEEAPSQAGLDVGRPVASGSVALLSRGLAHLRSRAALHRFCVLHGGEGYCCGLPPSYRE
jgi:hypothetical protein